MPGSEWVLDSCFNGTPSALLLCVSSVLETWGSPGCYSEALHKSLFQVLKLRHPFSQLAELQVAPPRVYLVVGELGGLQTF